MPGTESDAPAYRDAGLAASLAAAGCRAIDEGDLAVPSYLPHHTVPPFRNWPGPRIVWDLLASRLQPWLAQPGHVPLLIGCDCSVVVGSVQALGAAQDVHVLYVDGDFDDAPPDAAVCRSAAAMAVWLITNPSTFWSGPPLPPPGVTVLGWTNPPQTPSGVQSIPLADIRRVGAAEAARRALAGIPTGAAIVLHWDIDVLAEAEFPAAYFPHVNGMSIPEIAEMLGVILADPRIRIVEVSEYAALRDLDRVCVRKLVNVLSAASRSSCLPGAS